MPSANLFSPSPHDERSPLNSNSTSRNNSDTSLPTSMSNLVPHGSGGHFSPPDSRRSSAFSSRSGASLVLYRLTNEHDDRNPSFNSDPYDAASQVTTRQRAAHPFSNTPTTSQFNVPKNPPRGLVPYEYDPINDSMVHDEEDVLHDPNSTGKDLRKATHHNKGLSLRGLWNLGALLLLVLGLMTLFLVYPVIDHVQMAVYRKSVANNIHINATGQVPDLDLIRQPVDKDTPEAAKKRTGFDGKQYTLVYSDEFEESGRTFFPGDDPYLEAMDFWYGVTADLEWYDPRQVVTRDGAMIITMDVWNTTTPHLTPNSTAPFTQADNHNMEFRSGMVQSWNKFCFTNGYIEVGVKLPHNSDQIGLWPGAWTMGNLGRPGYRATTDAMWPYSYDSCDVGTFPNQTTKDGLGPPVSLPDESRGWPEYDYKLNMLNGQRLSACSCPNSDHPGPYGKLDGEKTARYRGRGVPEIDIIEIQHAGEGKLGNTASQSVQFAPMNDRWTINEAGRQIFDLAITEKNGYVGSPLQQAISSVTNVPDDGFQRAPVPRYVSYGFEYLGGPTHRDEGFITWQVDDKKSWTFLPSAVPGDPKAQVGQRIVPEEPMSIVLNMGISHGWGAMDLNTIQFPVEMAIDYVRVYQREGETNVGCNPKDFPTTDYINKHMSQYSNWDQLRAWQDEVPRNRAYEGSC